MCCSGSSLKPLQVQRRMGRIPETSLPCPSDSERVQEFVFLLSASQLCPHFKAKSSVKALQPHELRVCHFCHCWAFFMCVSLSPITAFQELLLPGKCQVVMKKVPKLQNQMQTNTSFHQLSARAEFLSDVRLQVCLFLFVYF